MPHNISITDDLYKDIKEYCGLNGLKISSLCCDLLKKAINELKYGDIPFGIIDELKGEKVSVQYNEPIEPHLEPIAFEDIPIRPIAKEIISVMPMNQQEDFPDETPIEEQSKTKNDKTKITKKVRVLK